MPKLSVVVPCYFNEANIPVTASELAANEANFPAGVEFEYVYVNDGSGDDTLGALRRAQQTYPGRIRIVDLAGNVGSYNAIVAGLAHATGDCMAVITPICRTRPPSWPRCTPTGSRALNWSSATGRSGKKPASRRPWPGCSTG